MSRTIQEILASPITWKEYVKDQDLRLMLSDMQSNVLKGHGRDHTGNVFLSFGEMSSDRIEGVLKCLSFSVTSALTQLRAAAAFKAFHLNGGRVTSVFLARGAYRKLGLLEPQDPAFLAGMRQRGEAETIAFDVLGPLPGLNDPKPETWDAGGPWGGERIEPDAMVLIGDDNPDAVTEGMEAVEKIVGELGVRILGADRGRAQRRVQVGGHAKGEGLEHFGYVDGVSQPLFLTEDIDGEDKDHWDPAFLPSQFLLPDPCGRTAFSTGSYFVYRKLEQNVKAFKEAEASLAAALTLTDPDRERAGALAVGRFEDGTPVVLHCAPVAGRPTNDFNYDGDPEGAQCPFRAHIRKTNPRGESDRRLGPVGQRGERSRIMARRGITYGDRLFGEDGDFADQPERDVGLLFMAYMADIAEQFEFTQCAWANNPSFVTSDAGVDPVIGQRRNTPHSNHTRWEDRCSEMTADNDFRTHVRLVGGEYFFAPSISFLSDPLA